MKILAFEPAEVARQAARIAADSLRAAVAERGKALAAFSGGRTPWDMFRALASEKLPWSQIEIFQVDERIVPPDDPARTVTSLHEALLSHVPIAPRQIHAMPVDASALTEAAAQYAREIGGQAFDLVHLGLGDDGHTASLVPGDPVLDIFDRDVALSGPYQGHRRMTLTYPTLNRTRTVLWLVTGAGKAEMLARLAAGDPAIPAGRIHREHAVIVADADAARLVSGTPDGMPPK